MRSPFAALWQAAVDKELQSLQSKSTFVPVAKASVPADKKLLGTRWVFTVKLLPAPAPADPATHGLLRFKARLVARGDTQREGEDFFETYAPVLNASTFRTMCAMAAADNLEVHQMDVVTAFLNAPLDEELYIRVPDGMSGDLGQALRLQRSLYGLRQAPRCWYQLLHQWLLEYGLQQSEFDKGPSLLPAQPPLGCRLGR